MMGKGCKSDAPLTEHEKLLGVEWLARNGFAYSRMARMWVKDVRGMTVRVEYPADAWHVIVSRRDSGGGLLNYGGSHAETRDVAAAVDMAVARTGTEGGRR